MGFRRSHTRRGLERTGAFCALLLVAACSSSTPGAAGATSATTRVDGHTITVSVPAGDSVTIAAIDVTEVPTAPDGLSFPLGALDIDVQHVAPGARTTVTVQLDTPVTAARKLINGVWDPFAYDGITGAELSGDGQTITVHLQDGGRGDSDGVADGTVADPIAPTIIDHDAWLNDYPPVVFPEADVMEGPPPLTVHFTSTGTYDPEGDPMFFIWDFGDGTTSTERNPTHTYTEAGGYDAWLTVYDALGKWRDQDRYIIVREPGSTTTTTTTEPPTSTTSSTTTTTTEPPTSTTSSTTSTSTTSTTSTTTTLPSPAYPVAAIAATPRDGEAPLVVHFDAFGSFDLDGTVVAYSWDFGDGNLPVTGPAPTHIYSSVGVYVAIVTVTDDGGHTDTATVIITVT